MINIKYGFAASTLPCHYNDWVIERVCLIIGTKILTIRKGKDRKRKLSLSVKSTCCSVKGTLIGDIVN